MSAIVKPFVSIGKCRGTMFVAITSTHSTLRTLWSPFKCEQLFQTGKRKMKWKQYIKLSEQIQMPYTVHFFSAHAGHRALCPLSLLQQGKRVPAGFRVREQDFATVPWPWKSMVPQLSYSDDFIAYPDYLWLMLWKRQSRDQTIDC